MKIKTLFGKIGIAASLGALWLFACTGGTGEGNPEFGTLSVSLRAQTAQPVPKASASPAFAGPGAGALAQAATTDTLRLFDEGRTQYNILHIYAHIDQIEIGRPTGVNCRSNDSVACTDSTVLISGSRYIDLLEKPSPFVLKELPLPLGVYNRMKVHFSKLVDLGDGKIPNAYVPLIGHSILMKGNIPYDSVPDRGLTIYLDINDAFAFENAAGLAISTDSPYNWAGIFLASRWLNNLEIRDCLKENKTALQPDGSLVMGSGTVCNEINDSLVENVRHSTYFQKSNDK